MRALPAAAKTLQGEAPHKHRQPVPQGKGLSRENSESQ